jgi:signal transduction histidine kinase
VLVSFKNISNQQLNISGEELMERFVRGDPSRSQDGSGLGLSIAKSLTELQGGSLELVIDGDLFKVLLGFELYRAPQKNQEKTNR